jgi:hypothetical protein
MNATDAIKAAFAIDAEARRIALEDAARAAEAVAAEHGRQDATGLSDRDRALLCGRIDGARLAAAAIREMIAS